MKRLLAISTIALALFGGAAYGQSGNGGPSGGALGSSASAPGTNAAGTATSSGGRRGGPAATGTGRAAVDKADRELDRKMKNICKGC